MERLYSQLLIIIVWSADILIFILSYIVLRGATVEMIMGVLPNGKRDVAIKAAITRHLW